MSNLREIKIRLRGIGKTRQITRAMKMVATVKLRQAQAALANARPYLEAMQAIALNVVSALDFSAIDHPLFRRRQNNKVLLVIIATDRGLCGNMNTSIFRQALRFVDELKITKTDQKPEMELLLIGRKARDYFKSRETAGVGGTEKIREYISFSGVNTGQMGAEFCELYRKGAYDRVDIFYNESFSALQHRPAHRTLLPLDFEKMRKERMLKRDNYMFEPAAADMIDEVMRAYASSALQRIMLESEVAENAARMMMMDLATKNADELISAMRLDMNKLRQYSITAELEDITTGVEAMG
jgi:F-type H+-transporting ATPase subunit gamma